MSGRDAIRHLLKQTSAEAQRRVEAGGIPRQDLEALRAFRDDVEKLLARLEPGASRGLGGPVLTKELFGLHERCTGPLEPFQGLLEDALSAAETVY